MSILRVVKSFQVFLVIAVSFVFLTILPLKGYCNDWVYVYKDNDLTMYYNSSSVKINKQNNTIKVWEKFVFTKDGKAFLFSKMAPYQQLKYKDIDHQVILNIYNYKEMKYTTIHITYYSTTNNVLFSQDYQPDWKNILPDSMAEIIYKRILIDYNLTK